MSPATTSIAKMRRAYFALLNELPGVDANDRDARHDLNERLVGKRSTREWSGSDWDEAVATLQRWNGQHQDGRAHIKSERRHGVASERGTFATWNQCRAIESMADQVDWGAGRDLGPVLYARKHLLRGDDLVLRREKLKQQEDAYAEEEMDRAAIWRALTRREASAMIQALDRMRQEYPVDN